MDFTIGGPLYGGKDLPISMTVYESSENLPEPDGYAYVAVVLGRVVCAPVILALVSRQRPQMGLRGLPPRSSGTDDLRSLWIGPPT